IENKHRHMLHVVVERIAECDHLDQRREKEKKQSQRITPDDDELLEQDCGKPSKRFVFHFHIFGLVIPSEARDLAKHAKCPDYVRSLSFHHHAAFCRSAACLAESSTNTSSSEGPIS